MGYFSWLTSDTKESIRVHKEKKVYLLQPNGLPPIEEPCYAGYGMFGEVDAFEWLAMQNLSQAIIQAAEKADIPLSMLGIYLDYKYFIDSRNGQKYCFAFSPVNKLFDDLILFRHYEISIGDSTPNNLIASGVWIQKSLTDYFGPIKYPLKFSFDVCANYETLPASDACPAQGYF